MNIDLESMAIEMPEVAAHPNRVAFRGVLTFVDTPSDSAPSGARGHRVLLKRVATERAIPSLLGMGLDYAPSLDRHDARRKVGVITLADIGADRTDRSVRPTLTSALQVGGYLYARDFPELVREIRAKGPKVLGMSYEIAEAKIDDVGAEIWTVTDFAFTGAAVLRRDKAAYKQTWIEIQ